MNISYKYLMRWLSFRHVIHAKYQEISLLLQAWAPGEFSNYRFNPIKHLWGIAVYKLGLGIRVDLEQKCSKSETAKYSRTSVARTLMAHLP